MNTQSVKAAFLSLATVVLLTVTAFSSKANDNKNKEAAISKKQVAVTYKGSNENNVVFRVQFHNPTAQKFSFIVKNHEGDILYSGQFNDMEFSKTIHLLKEEEEMNPVFIIRTNNQTIENSFTVTSSADSNEVTVAKL